MPEPIRCWCWNDGVTATRKTVPSIRLIREIIDGAGIEVNGYYWPRAQRISEGHPVDATDAALEAVYVARWQARNTVAPDIRANFADMEAYRKETLQSWLAPSGTCVEIAPSTEQPHPSALSRIWAILRGR